MFLYIIVLLTGSAFNVGGIVHSYLCFINAGKGSGLEIGLFIISLIIHFIGLYYAIAGDIGLSLACSIWVFALWLTVASKGEIEYSTGSMVENYVNTRRQERLSTGSDPAHEAAHQAADRAFANLVTRDKK